MFANTFLVAGEESRAQTTFWSDSVRHGQHSKKLQANSYLVQSIIHCSYGPEDNSHAVPESLMTAPAERKAANKRTGKTERGQSCKRGCLMQFTVSQLAAWPEVTRIIGRHFDHVNAAGVRCHGPEAPGVSSKLQRAPHLSVKTRGWVRTLLSAGISTNEIMRKHQKRFDEDMQNGSLTRDSFLKRQDVRNLEHNLAEKVWKLHEDEATSVRLFKQQHDKNVFMYTEQQPAQPASDGQPSQPARPFVIGLVTDDMRAAALQTWPQMTWTQLPLQVVVEAAAKPAPTKRQTRQQRCMECKACLNRAIGKQGCERNKAKRLAEKSSAVQELDV